MFLQVVNRRLINPTLIILLGSSLFLPKPTYGQEIDLLPNPPSKPVLCDLKSSPKHPGGYKILGNVFSKKSQYEKALECFQQALQDPRGAEDPQVWNGYGLSLSKLRRYEDAIAAYNQAIAIPPPAGLVDRVYRPDVPNTRLEEAGYYIIWFNKAVALYEIKDYQNAKLAVNASLKLNSEFQLAIDLEKLITEKLQDNLKSPTQLTDSPK